VYVVSETTGEPYNLARIMEFIRSDNGPRRPTDALRVNWYYRPRDIGKANCDTRLVFATMHSDITPVNSLRGKCRILHRDQIKDLNEFRAVQDSFYYNQLFDRLLNRCYEVIPTSKVLNVPKNVREVLNKRWQFVFVETGSRCEELTSPCKTCSGCGKYCARYVPYL